MQVVSLSKFRTNQTVAFLRAIQGESVFLTSRLGNFKLMPISAEERIATRIKEGLKEAKQIEEGKLPCRTIEDLLDEL